MKRRLAAFVKRVARMGGVDVHRYQPPIVSSASQLFAPKFSTGDIAREISRIKTSQTPVCVLTDGYVAPPPGAGLVIDCRTGRGEDLAALPAETLFFYACDSDEIGIPWVRTLIQQRRRFYPVGAYSPSTYAHINDLARRTLEAEFVEQTALGFAKWDFGPGYFLNLVQAIDLTANIEGDYVEIGCYRGSSACVAVRYMHARRMARHCYFFDTFDGFSYDAARTSSDAVWSGTHATEGEQSVRHRIERHADAAQGLRVTVERLNIVEQELPQSIRNVAMANVDVDLYEAVRDGIAKIAPRIVPGGILIVEDPGHTPALIGSRVALSDFMETSLAQAFTPVYVESGQTLLIRR
jgi:hypothetical protein